MEDNKCPECKAYTGHHPECSFIDEEYAKSELKRYYRAWLSKDTENQKLCQMYNERAQKKINRLKDERDIWKGRFLSAKEENNILRKRQLKQTAK